MSHFTMHPAQGDEDYWRVRQFVREVLTANEYRQRSWDVQRLDYWRWHALENILHKPLSEVFFVWETRRGEIGAVLCPEGIGEAFFHIHPGVDTPALEADILAEAETRLADENRKLVVWVNENLRPRQRLLAERGYQKGSDFESQRWQTLEKPIALPQLPEGYSIRALGGREELPARSWLSWRAFHPDSPDAEYEGWEWYLNVQRAPLYRRDLDLVAVAADGTLAGFTTIWFDDWSRTAVFEPVGVEPTHHRRGLGKAMLLDGLRRVQRLGARIGYVGSYSQAAGALYAAAGFVEFERCEPWSKVLSL